MADKFGLDWKKHDNIRMGMFMHLIRFLDKTKNATK